jgi:hypothetical protein
MSEPIGSYPGLSIQTYVIFRCNRWGTYVRWLSRTGIASVEPKNVASWWGPIVLEGNVEQLGITARDVCPVNIQEARETGRCVMALPDALKLTLIQEHCVRGKQQEKADAMGIDRVTFWRRCQRAYDRLLGLMNDAAAGLPVRPAEDDEE